MKKDREEREIDEEKIAKVMKRRNTKSSKYRLELLRKYSTKDKKKQPKLIRRKED